MSALYGRVLEYARHRGAEAVVAVARDAEFSGYAVRGLESYPVHVVHERIRILAHALFRRVAVHTVDLEREIYRDVQPLQEHDRGLHLLKPRISEAEFRRAL